MSEQTRSTFNTLKCRNFGCFFAHKTILMLVVCRLALTTRSITGGWPWCACGACGWLLGFIFPGASHPIEVKWKVLLALQTRRFLSSAAFAMRRWFCWLTFRLRVKLPCTHKYKHTHTCTHIAQTTRETHCVYTCRQWASVWETIEHVFNRHRWPSKTPQTQRN